MKNKILSVVLLGALMSSSCDNSVIDLNPIGDTEVSFFQNEEQMQQAIFGIYQKLAFFYSFRGGQNNHVLPVTMLPSDDLTTFSSSGFENFVSLNGGTSQLSLYYQFAYQLIARANIVLEKIDEASESVYKKNPELKNYNRGEALFLRSYMYFNLWNVFGTAPLVTSRITDLSDAYPPNSSKTELLDQAISDLTEAVDLLPESWGEEFRGRIVKNSALALKGKCLMFRGTVLKSQEDFTNAIKVFDSIKGVELTSKYSQNFDVNYENNIESLFEYQANSSPGAVNPFVGGAGGNDSFSVIGEIGAYWGSFSKKPTWIGNSIFSATTSIIEAYEKGDPRLEYNINLLSEDGVNVMKYIRNTSYPQGQGAINEISTNNPRILRYADVLLLKAEAIVRTGGSLQQAISIINQIRERARNSGENGVSNIPADYDINETDRDKVLEWIFNERRLELAFEEGHRWWDLRRRYLAGEIDLCQFDFSSSLIDCKFTSYNVNFPLPNSEVVENPNLKQNEGY